MFKFENEFGFLQATADQQQLRPVQAIAQILSDLNKQKSVKTMILNLSQFQYISSCDYSQSLIEATSDDKNETYYNAKDPNNPLLLYFKYFILNA